jgi:hypothetical protein
VRPLEDRDVDARERQLAREHHARRAFADDRQSVLVPRPNSHLATSVSAVLLLGAGDYAACRRAS